MVKLLTYPHILSCPQKEKVAKRKILWIMMETSQTTCEFTTLPTVLRDYELLFFNFNTLKSKPKTNKTTTASVTFLYELTRCMYNLLTYWTFCDYG